MVSKLTKKVVESDPFVDSLSPLIPFMDATLCHTGVHDENK